MRLPTVKVIRTFVSGIAYVIADNFMGPQTSLAIAVVAGFAIRALAIVYDWTLPKFGADY